MMAKLCLCAYLVLAVPAIYADETSGIPYNCSAKRFDAAASAFFAGFNTSVRVRILPTYGDHLQIGFVEMESRPLEVQLLTVHEKVSREESTILEECPVLTVRERRFVATSRIRDLYNDLLSLRVDLLFPPILYLDDTEYQVQLRFEGGSTELSWLGLDEPENRKKYPLSAWVAELRRAIP